MSFQKYLTPIIIADIIVRDKRFKGNYLIVEGKTDKFVFSQFIEKENNRISVAEGANKVVEVINIVGKRKRKGVLGIIDSDFRNILGEKELPKNIFQTDTHDLETLIIKSPTFEKVLDLLGSSKKTEKFKENSKLSLREYLLNLVKPLAYLKLASHKNRLNLRFKPKSQSNPELKFEKFIDKKEFEFLGIEKMIDTIRSYNNELKLSNQELEKLLKSEEKDKYDLWQLCNGHDIVKVFSIGLKNKIGSENKRIEDIEKGIEKLLIAGYEFRYFKKTNLYSSIISWQNKKRMPLIFEN